MKYLITLIRFKKKRVAVLHYPQYLILMLIICVCLCIQNIVPGEIMEEVNELFVKDNKLNLAVADANTLPTISITKVTHSSSIQDFSNNTANGHGGQYWTWQ